MTDLDFTDLEFAERLTITLDALADTATVTVPEPRTVKRGPSGIGPTNTGFNGTGRPGSPRRDRVLLVAACLIAAVALGGMAAAIGGRAAPNRAGGPSESGEAVGADAAPVEIVLWLDVNVTAAQVDELVGTLEADGRAESIDYVDRDATYQDFLRAFVDEPELTALVDPDQLPTSFLVTVPGAEAAEFLRWAATLPHLNGIERLNERSNANGSRETDQSQADLERELIEAELAARRELAASLLAERSALEARLHELEAGTEPADDTLERRRESEELKDAITESQVRLDAMNETIAALEAELRQTGGS